MSRRYGRNQRRKARAEIARLEAVATEHHRKAMNYQQGQAAAEAEMVEWAYRIVTLLGEDSAFARELVEVHVEPAIFRDHVQRFYPMRLDPVLPQDPFSRDIGYRAGRIIDAFALYAYSERDHLRDARLFEIVSREGGRALMMDGLTMHRLRLGKSHELARYLLESLIKEWMEGRQ